MAVQNMGKLKKEGAEKAQGKDRDASGAHVRANQARALCAFSGFRGREFALSAAKVSHNSALLMKVY